MSCNQPIQEYLSLNLCKKSVAILFLQFAEIQLRFAQIRGNQMENINAARLTERYCALVIGVLFLILGIAGFIPAFVSLPGTTASYIPANMAHGAYSAGFGYVFGLFPTNFLHNLVHCAVGLLGIASYTNATSARLFNAAFAVAYIIIAIMGLLPFGKTMFGLMPIFGNNVWLNALTAIAAGYYGLIIPNKIAGTNVSHNV